MSQIYKPLTSSGPIPPSIATSYVTDNGTAVPAANILLINGKDSTENNDNGIITKGGVVGTGTSNEVDVVITNRATGTATTTDATPTTSLTFSLATPGSDGVFFIEGFVVAYDITDTAGGSYSFVSGARTTAGVGIEIGTEFKDVLEEAAMATADFSVSVSGNNFIITVVGIAGKTIHWNCYLTYRFVS